MNTVKPKLTSWDEYETLPDNARGNQSQATYDFHARWQFAGSFTGVIVNGYASRTAPKASVPDAYHSLLKVLLACSAREQLLKILDRPTRNPHTLAIVNESLANQLRSELRASSQQKLYGSLRKSAKGSIEQPLEDFFKGQSGDIAPVAFAIRHGIAHGSLTPTGADINAIRTVNMILSIAESVLEDSDRRFTEWVLAKKGLHA